MSDNGTDGLAPSEFAEFKIGGKILKVKALTLWDLEVAKEPILALNGDIWWAEYANRVCEIIALVAPEHGTKESLLRSCSMGEAQRLSEAWGDLLTKSGFAAAGEESAAGESPGTGTSTLSSPTSQSEESVAAIPGESSGS